MLETSKLIFQQSDRRIVKISDGIVVKYGGSVNLYEAQVMEYITKENIPVPKIYSYFKHGNINYIIMEEVQGVSLDSIWDSLTDDGRTKATKDIMDIITQLQRVEADSVGRLNGGSCPDGIFEPLVDNGVKVVGKALDFNNFILTVLHRKLKTSYSNVLVDGLSSNGRIVFTHADLVPRNIMVSGTDNKIVAVLDWEFAGFYPEYWEYHKCLYSVNWSSSWVSSFLRLLPQNKKSDVALMATIRRFNI